MGFDLSAALERVGGDQELLKEIAELFIEDGPLLLKDVRAAVDAGDTTALQRSAHSLKGSVANFGADAAVEAALNLEKMGANGTLDGAPEALASLESEIQKLVAVLSAIE